MTETTLAAVRLAFAEPSVCCSPCRLPAKDLRLNLYNTHDSPVPDPSPCQVDPRILVAGCGAPLFYSVPSSDPLETVDLIFDAASGTWASAWTPVLATQVVKSVVCCFTWTTGRSTVTTRDLTEAAYPTRWSMACVFGQVSLTRESPGARFPDGAGGSEEPAVQPFGFPPTDFTSCSPLVLMGDVQVNPGVPPCVVVVTEKP